MTYILSSSFLSCATSCFEFFPLSSILKCLLSLFWRTLKIHHKFGVFAWGKQQQTQKNKTNEEKEEDREEASEVGGK